MPNDERYEKGQVESVISAGGAELLVYNSDGEIVFATELKSGVYKASEFERFLNDGEQFAVTRARFKLKPPSRFSVIRPDFVTGANPDWMPSKSPVASLEAQFEEHKFKTNLALQTRDAAHNKQLEAMRQHNEQLQQQLAALQATEDQASGGEEAHAEAP